MRKTIKNVVLTILFLALIVSTALLAYLHFFALDDMGLSGDKDISGEWTAELDMTQQAAFTALSWLQDIEGVSVSMEDMESYMQDLTIQVNLTLEQTAQSEGTFRCSVLPDSYDACYQAAYEAFAEVFRELLTKRLCMADYTGGTDKETIEALVTETFGMPTVSYLMSYGPALLPSLEDLQVQYDGRGTYVTADGILTRQFDADRPVATSVECYMCGDFDLILYEETDSVSPGLLPDYYPMVFTLVQTQDQ